MSNSNSMCNDTNIETLFSRGLDQSLVMCWAQLTATCQLLLQQQRCHNVIARLVRCTVQPQLQHNQHSISISQVTVHHHQHHDWLHGGFHALERDRLWLGVRLLQMHPIPQQHMICVSHATCIITRSARHTSIGHVGTAEWRQLSPACSHASARI